MTDPKRLLDDAGLLTDQVRQVLAADARFNAPPEARSRLWSPLASAISAASIGTALPNAVSAASGAGVGTQAATVSASVGQAIGVGAVVKLTLVGIGFGASIATANHYWAASGANEPKQAISVPLAAPTKGSVSVSTYASHETSVANRVEPARHRTGEKAGAPLNRTAAAQSVEFPSTAGDPRDAAHLPETSGARGPANAAPNATPEYTARAREESQLVGSARSLLRSGNAAAALQLIERASGRFPNGILIQEREALRIEALTVLGRTREARTLAESFMRTYPNSPHVSRVRGASSVQP